jgi:hypothetical protein
MIFSASGYSGIRIEGDNTLLIFDFTGSFNYKLATTQVFRDLSAWYHLVFALDTTQATASNRLKLYINGIEVTQFSATTYPSLNYDGFVNAATAHNIGRNPDATSEKFNGYLANVQFIDGQALTPSSFTEVSATTGQLIPKAYTGTYGTNGFYLQFADNSSNTASTLGKDTSGNGNNWTPNNFSVTSGTGSYISNVTSSSGTFGQGPIYMFNGLVSNDTYSSGAGSYVQWSVSSYAFTGTIEYNIGGATYVTHDGSTVANGPGSGYAWTSPVSISSVSTVRFYRSGAEPLIRGVRLNGTILVDYIAGGPGNDSLVDTRLRFRLQIQAWVVR